MRLIDVYEVPEAVHVLWDLLVERSKENDPQVNISHRGLPAFEDHERFFGSRPYAHWYLIDVGGSWIGYVNVTKRNEVGVILFQEFRGRGYGPQAVQLLIDTVKPLSAVSSERSGHFVANINPKNERSIHVFTKLGFAHVQNTYELRGAD